MCGFHDIVFVLILYFGISSLMDALQESAYGKVQRNEIDDLETLLFAAVIYAWLF